MLRIIIILPNDQCEIILPLPIKQKSYFHLKNASNAQDTWLSPSDAKTELQGHMGIIIII